jgi:hypothetical protein
VGAISLVPEDVEADRVVPEWRGLEPKLAGLRLARCYDVSVRGPRLQARDIRLPPHTRPDRRPIRGPARKDPAVTLLKNLYRTIGIGCRVPNDGKASTRIAGKRHPDLIRGLRRRIAPKSPGR